VTAAAELSHSSDTQFARRMYVRSAFALVEGNINLMADLILRAAARNEIKLAPDENKVLRQEQESSSGERRRGTRVRFVSMRDRMAPVFQLFSHLYGRTFRLDKATQGWVDFLAALDVRNRITHPKNAASFAISDEELNAVERARQWFADRVQALLDE